MVTDKKWVKNSTPKIIALDKNNNPSEKQGESGSLRTQQSQLQCLEESTYATRSNRPQRTIVKPIHYREENFISTYSYFFVGPIDDEEPRTFEETKGNKEWKHAMDAEMKALKKITLGALFPSQKKYNLFLVNGYTKSKSGRES